MMTNNKEKKNKDSGAYDCGGIKLPPKIHIEPATFDKKTKNKKTKKGTAI